MRGFKRGQPFKIGFVTSVAIWLMAAAPGFGQSSQGFDVAGVVLDPSGAVVVGAKIVILHEGSPKQSSSTNQNGRFQFRAVTAGDYDLEISKEGFRTATTHLTVGPQITPIQIRLLIAEVHEELSVVDKSDSVNTSPGENLNVIKLDSAALKNLPILGNDVIGSIANLLDAGSIGSGGPTIIVDGLETSRRKVPASQIQEVRINQNPYSAEFSRPGRGRIEVITKIGSPEYHGEFNLVFRDHRLDARNAFASKRPPEQRRIFEGILTGPLGSSKKTSFLVGIDREEEDLQAVVFASTPAGVVSENIATPNRDTEISVRIDHQPSKKTTLSIRYELTFDASDNDGVGGFTLPEAATNSKGREHEIFLTHRMVISPHLVNEFTMRADTEKGLTRSVRPGISRIVVLDAFTGGGSQVDRRSTSNNIQFNEIVSWSHGRHFIRSGLNVPNITRRGSSDRTNFGGTFTFSTLTDFLNSRPFTFSINQGDGHLVFWQRDLGLFVHDSILVRPNFSLAAGLRYDWQNYLGDNNNVAPRFSFAYAPDKERKTVLRGGAGIFYDRTGSTPIGETLRFNGQRLRQVTISDPGFPDPLSSGGTLAARPSNIVRFRPGVRSPYTIQSSLGVERQLNKSLTAVANYTYTRGIKLFRSRNVNAPPPPYLETPDPTVGVLRQVESAAHSEAHALAITLRGKISRVFNGTVQYILGRAYNDASGINSLPANNFDLTGEWSRAEFDERHRFNLLGAIEAGEWFNLGLTLSLTSGRPYSLTTGRDDNRDSIANDRPAGVRRNTLRGPEAGTLDMRWSKEFQVKKTGKENEGPVVTISVDAFNVLNRTNFAGFIGNLSSSFFGLPVASRPARRMQLTVGFQF